MGKKTGNKKKFRALDPKELDKADKKAAASTSQIPPQAADGTGQQEAVEDIPLPSGPEPNLQRKPSSANSNCQSETVQNSEDEHQTGEPTVKVQTQIGTNTRQSKPNHDGSSRASAGSRYNESRHQRTGPKPRSKERPKDSAAADGKTSGIIIWNNGDGQVKASNLNIHAKAFEPSRSGFTEQNWNSATDANLDMKPPVEPMKNFSQVVSQRPKMTWPEELTNEENQYQEKYKGPIEEITDQWPEATNLDKEQVHERSSEHNENKEHTTKDDDGWNNWRRKSGEADGSGSSRRSYDKKGSYGSMKSSQRHFENERSPSRRSHDNKRSSQHTSYDNKRSSQHTSYDNKRSSLQTSYYDNSDKSSPHRNHSSPHRNSYGGGRGEGSTPTWGERGSSSERDSDYREYCSLARSRDKPEFVKVKEIEGDLFAQSKEYSLAHCVAEDMGMGSGIAVQFRRDFKRVPELLNQRQKQGGLAVLDDNNNDNRYIYYMVTKRVSNGKPTYHTLFSSMKKLREHMRENGVTKLAIPRIGCGLDRLEWCFVKPMLEYVFRNDDVEIIVCNFQQDENAPPSKLKRGHLVKEEKPIQDIEDGTIIIYTTSTEDDDTSPEMQELDKKFPCLLAQLRNSPKRPGKAIVYDKNPNYRLYGCVVKLKKNDRFDYVEFQKCISAIDKENRKLEFCYIAFQIMTDPNDDVINEKVINIVRNGMRNVDVYVCGSSPEKSSAF